MQQYRALPDQPAPRMSNDLASPQGSDPVIKTITAAALDELSGKAVAAERRRAHLNVHASLDANVQRLFIATEPDTYMRPHRHPEASRRHRPGASHRHPDTGTGSRNSRRRRRTRSSRWCWRSCRGPCARC